MHLVVSRWGPVACSRLLGLVFTTFFATCVVLHLGLCSFFQLGKAHLRALWVLLEDALVGLAPLVQDVLQAFVGLSLCSIDQVTDLEPFFSQLNHTLVVFCKDLTFAHLQLL